MHIHTFMHTHIRTYIHACIDTYAHTHMHAYTHAHTCKYSHIRYILFIRTHMHAYTHMHTCVCIHICTYIRVCMHAYTHVLRIKHPGEVAGKSTAVHARMLAQRDVTIHPFPSIPYIADPARSVLIYPKEVDRDLRGSDIMQSLMLALELGLCTYYTVHVIPTHSYL